MTDCYRPPDAPGTITTLKN